MDRATIRLKKTGRPVRFELADQARMTIDEYLKLTGRKSGQFLFAGRGDSARGLTTRQYARLVQEWVASIGLDPSKYGTHSLRRTKAADLSADGEPQSGAAVARPFEHREHRSLGLEVDDAIEIAEKINV
jgi:integrase